LFVKAHQRRESIGGCMSEAEWVSLRQAAEMLGVHPATVRNWADKGDLPSRRTPGGHRRFRKNDLLQHAETQGELQPLEVRGLIQDSLSETRMQVGVLSTEAAYANIVESTRQQVRSEARRVFKQLVQYIAHGALDSRRAEAGTLGKSCAQYLANVGLELTKA